MFCLCGWNAQSSEFLFQEISAFQCHFVLRVIAQSLFVRQISFPTPTSASAVQVWERGCTSIAAGAHTRRPNCSRQRRTPVGAPPLSCSSSEPIDLSPYKNSSTPWRCTPTPNHSRPLLPCLGFPHLGQFHFIVVPEADGLLQVVDGLNVELLANQDCCQFVVLLSGMEWVFWD